MSRAQRTRSLFAARDDKGQIARWVVYINDIHGVHSPIYVARRSDAERLAARRSFWLRDGIGGVPVVLVCKVGEDRRWRNVYRGGYLKDSQNKCDWQAAKAAGVSTSIQDPMPALILAAG